MKKVRFLAIVMAALLLGLVAQVRSVNAESTLEVIKKRGKILLGTKTDYAPFAYLDASQNYAGFDVEIWREFARRLGVQLKFVPITSQSRIPLLLNKTVDVVSGGTTHTRKRDEVIDYSITYFMDGLRLLVRKDSGIKSYKDLEAPKTTAVTQGANTGPIFLRVQPKAKLVYFQEFPQIVLALKQGKVDGLACDNVMLGIFAKDNPELEVVGDFLSLEPYGMPMRENDSKWRDWINFSLQAIWDDGTYARLHRKIFGKDPDYKIEYWQP